MITFIFIFWWFGPFWRRYFVDFIDNYLFYPLEMVENGLIRDWKWQLKNLKSLIMLSPTQHHHLWPNFNSSDTPKEKILVIFSINTTFTPWLNRKCLIRAQICSKSDPVWLKCQEYHCDQLFKPKKGVRSYSYWIILMILVKISHFTPWFETKVVIPEAAPEYQLPFLDFCDAQHSSKLWWKNWRWYPEQN